MAPARRDLNQVKTDDPSSQSPQMLASPTINPFNLDGQFPNSPPNHFPRPLFMGAMDHDPDQYSNVRELRDTITALEIDLDTQKKRNNTLEESYQKMGVLRMAVEAEFADTRKKLTEELDEQKRINADLSSKLDLTERSRAKLEDKVNRMNSELMAVMKKKYELTQQARMDAMKKLADDERIRGDLAREQRRLEQSRARSPSTPPLVQKPPVPIVQSPTSIRCTNALRELRDFFEF